jgi:GT2 family glycosyltransferase
VVIVNWNGREFLGPCLEALAQQTFRRFEVLVVDNGSTDGSAELVRTSHPDVTLLLAGENLGFAEGCNRGIERSRGEWVCMLNNDTIPDPRWLEALVEAAREAGPDCGMLQSLMLLVHRPGFVNSTGIVLRPDGGGVDRGDGEAAEGFRDGAPIFCPTAGAAAYRRALLEQVRLRDGYFDRRHFLYLEDLDLGWRARLAGWNARYVPGSVVRHHWHGSSDRHGEQALARLSAINRWRTLAKNASWPFFAGAIVRSTPELWRLWRRGGRATLQELYGALRESLETRAEVSRLARTERRALEKVWVDR